MYSTSTSQSQTSADDDFINEFGRSCSCSTLTDTTFGVSTGCCAKDVIENLMVQLKEKDVQLKEKDAQLKEKDEQIKVFESPFILGGISLSIPELFIRPLHLF
jgi:hypothetical protein